MSKIKHLLTTAKNSWNITVTMVFLISGLMLLTIDSKDLKAKGLKKDLKICRIFGYLYVFGAMAAFVLCRYLM